MPLWNIVVRTHDEPSRAFPSAIALRARNARTAHSSYRCGFHGGGESSAGQGISGQRPFGGVRGTWFGSGDRFRADVRGGAGCRIQSMKARRAGRMWRWLVW